MIKELMSLLVKLGIDSSDLDKGLDKSEAAAKKSAGNIQQSMLKMADGLDKAGNALTLGVTVPMVAFGTASIKAAMDSESAMAELNAVIKSTGGVAKVSAQDVTDYATAMQKVTKFDDEAIISGQSMLLTFTKIGKDVFPAASTAMLNMAEKFGSIEQASMQLGKALNDPVAGVGALRRVGVALTDQQEQQIKAFMAVNDIASAQKIILKELETEFGGLAVAAGDTTAGKFIQFKNALGDLQEVVGAALLPNLISLTNGLRGLIDGFMGLPPGAQNAVIGFGVLLAALGPTLKVLSMFVTVASALAPGGALAGAGAGLAGLGAAIGALAIPILIIIATVALFVAAFQNDFLGISTTALMVAQLFSDAWGENGVLGVLDLLGTFIRQAFMMQLQNLWTILKGIGSFIVGNFTTGLRNIVTVLNWVIAGINKLGFSLSALKIPDWITPGSPTPFEMGLRGINDAMQSITSGSLPTMTAGLKFENVGPLPTSTIAAGGMASSGSAGGMIVNLMFGDGVTRDEVHTLATGAAESAADKLRRAMGVA